MHNQQPTNRIQSERLLQFASLTIVTVFRSIEDWIYSADKKPLTERDQWRRHRSARRVRCVSKRAIYRSPAPRARGRNYTGRGGHGVIHLRRTLRPACDVSTPCRWPRTAACEEGTDRRSSQECHGRQRAACSTTKCLGLYTSFLSPRSYCKKSHGGETASVPRSVFDDRHLDRD